MNRLPFLLTLAATLVACSATYPVAPPTPAATAPVRGEIPTASLGPVLRAPDGTLIIDAAAVPGTSIINTTHGSNDGNQGNGASSPTPSAVPSPTADPSPAGSPTSPEPSAAASPGATMFVFSGSGARGHRDDSAFEATFDRPLGLARSGAGMLLVADANSQSVRAVDQAGDVVTLATSETSSSAFVRPYDLVWAKDNYFYMTDEGANAVFSIAPNGGAGVHVGEDGQFDGPRGITSDGKGNLYVADANHSELWRIDAAGELTAFAGGTAGFKDGPLAEATFDHPDGLAMDRNGNLYVADAGNHRIRKITPSGVVSTLAGGSVSGLRDGRGGNARFGAPSGLTVGPGETLYVAEPAADRVRRVAKDGTVTTLAVSLSGPSHLVFDATGALYVTCSEGHQVVRLTLDP